VQSFVVKSSFVDPTGVNAVVLEGLRKDELETLSEVIHVFPDRPVYSTAYSWGIDRIDQPSLPLSSTYTSAFKGCGVDIYIIDTGIDTNHIEFSPTIGPIRTVENIFNELTVFLIGNCLLYMTDNRYSRRKHHWNRSLLQYLRIESSQ